MSFKQFVAVAAAAATASTIGLTSLSPQPPANSVKEQQQQVRDLAHNEQKVHSQLNDEGNALQDADNLDRLRPVEPRPVGPELELHIPEP